MKRPPLCRLVFAFVASLFLSGLLGCWSGETIVVDPAAGGYKASDVDFVQQKSSSEVPEPVALKFRLILEQEHWKAGFTRGKNLIINYTIIDSKPGEKFGRVSSVGKKTGEGVMAVDVEYTDGAGKKLAKIRVVGKVEFGVLGGSYDRALKKAATEIARYSTQHFK